MEAVKELSESEKQLLQFSLPIINKNMEFLVIRFYHHFLQTKAGVLFKHTKMEDQYKMFASSLNAIITHIANPYLLTDNLDVLIQSHVTYGVMEDHIDYFIESFMKALGEVFNNEQDKTILKLWKKLITNIMMYFKEQLI